MNFIKENPVKKITMGCLLLAVFLFFVLNARDRLTGHAGGYELFNKTILEPKVSLLKEGVYQVNAIAGMWQYEPAEIHIPAGSKVHFMVTSRDVVHGFEITEMKLNLMAASGKISKAIVTFDKPGVYKILCREYCGDNHQNMKARVVVSNRQ